ncbi:MAG: DNA replication/repair protein RecF [Candidatus Obscuribacterales bacterium]|nr:DNA replication/repair protein RecF [Candidatus Obscuribacterales bacterium]
MRITKICLENFRNYENALLEPHSFGNIILGENAQGKSNLLEAIEYASTGKAYRAAKDFELVRHGVDNMKLEINFEAEGMTESISIFLKSKAGAVNSNAVTAPLQREIKVNGVKQSSAAALKRRLIVVSFKSQDLNIVRGGPAFRRDWIDTLLCNLRASTAGRLQQYQKIVAQRNRLLKIISEHGRFGSSDKEQLKTWDIQVAKAGAEIVRERLNLMSDLIPLAEKHHERLSGKREKLTSEYVFKSKSPRDGSQNQDGDDDDEDDLREKMKSFNIDDLKNAETREIAKIIYLMLKDIRAEEIARKQTLIGPHRDDISFHLDGKSAMNFGSQGQQRSLVLSLKLSELEAVRGALNEQPVLLLDDVLAELDLLRQDVLMEMVGSGMQTFVTTTHLSTFKPEWLADSQFFNVEKGYLSAVREPIPR